MDAKEINLKREKFEQELTRSNWRFFYAMRQHQSEPDTKISEPDN